MIAGYFQLICTQSVEEFIAPYTGTYKLQCWGAAGTSKNSDDYYGGKGGYSEGIWKSTIDKIALYVCVGQVGIAYYPSYNNKPDKSTSFSVGFDGGFSGGGSTNITTTDRGELKNFASDEYKKEVLIVAGGGGGLEWDGRSGAGGDFDGKDGNSFVDGACKGTGGSQESGGITGAFSGGTSVNGMFGVGGYGCIYRESYKSYDYGAQGGGGWYGGGGASFAGAAGGGSSYIGGVTDGKTIAGDSTDPKQPTPDGKSEQVGQSGDGACVITQLSFN
mgnify:FL=1